MIRREKDFFVVYAPFQELFPGSPPEQRLCLEILPAHEALPPGRYALHDLYPLSAGLRGVFYLNICSPEQQIMATLCGQWRADGSLALQLSPEHLQSTLAPALLAATWQLLNAPRSPARKALLQRAEAVQKHKSITPKAEAPENQRSPALEDLQLLQTDALDMLLTHYSDPEDQEALIHALLEEIRQLMLQELENHRLRQQPPAPENIIRFPLERLQAAVAPHWLDLHVELSDLPGIWRRLRLPDNLSLSQLHQLLQISMGWQNQHHWRFISAKAEYVSYSQMQHTWEDEQDADQIRLSQVLGRKGGRLDYEYDFGDSWYHRIKVEARHSPASLKLAEMQCLEGAGACPPENCGGFLGYQQLLAVRAKKRKSPADKALLSWLGDFDPESLDLEQINQQLSQLLLD